MKKAPSLKGASYRYFTNHTVYISHAFRMF